MGGYHKAQQSQKGVLGFTDGETEAGAQPPSFLLPGWQAVTVSPLPGGAHSGSYLSRLCRVANEGRQLLIL